MEAQVSAEGHLKERNIVLPSPPRPVGSYVEGVRVGNTLYLAGHGGGAEWRGRGKVGKDITLEEGYQAARDAGLHLLATVRGASGRLAKGSRAAKAGGTAN